MSQVGSEVPPSGITRSRRALALSASRLVQALSEVLQFLICSPNVKAEAVGRVTVPILATAFGRVGLNEVGKCHPELNLHLTQRTQLLNRPRQLVDLKFLQSG